MCWNVGCVWGHSNAYSSLRCYPSNETHLTLQMIFFLWRGWSGGVQDKSFKELNSHINWVCSCFLTLLFLSVEKLEFPSFFFFSCRESKTDIVMLTRIWSNWHWYWTNQTQRKIFPYHWGRTNGLWYCLVKKLIDIYSYGPSFAHYTDWCQA